MSELENYEQSDRFTEREKIALRYTDAIVWNAGRAHVITGPISIMLANAMLGELTPKMAEALSSSPAKKILLPINQEQVDIIGITKEPLPHLVEALIQNIKEIIKNV